MDRIECPTCQTQYTFERAGIHPPNEDRIAVAYTTICSTCGAKFESTIQWQSVKTRHDQRNWFSRVILRQPPLLDYEFRIQARSRKV